MLSTCRAFLGGIKYVNAVFVEGIRSETGQAIAFTDKPGGEKGDR